jgi:hypothetical protein
MASAADLAALATVVNVQVPSALTEALREIQRLRDENQRIYREYLALKVCALRGDVYVNRTLDANLRYPTTWAEAVQDLGDEAALAWAWGMEQKMQLDELKERGSESEERTSPHSAARRRTAGS